MLREHGREMVEERREGRALHMALAYTVKLRVERREPMSGIDPGAGHRDPSFVRYEGQTYLADTGRAEIRRLHVESDEAERSVGR